jgi:hypothetical protein
LVVERGVAVRWAGAAIPAAVAGNAAKTAKTAKIAERPAGKKTGRARREMLWTLISLSWRKRVRPLELGGISS